MTRLPVLRLLATATAVRQPSRFMSATATWAKQNHHSKRSAAFGLVAASVAAATGLLYSTGVAEAEAKEEKKGGDLHYKFVIIGAGVAAKSCLDTLTQLVPGPVEGYDGKIFMIGNDPRMNAINKSEDELKGQLAASHDPQTKIELGREATKLDVVKKTVRLADGTVVTFDKCFVATGGHYSTMKNVAPAAADRVATFRRQKDLAPILEGHKAGKVKHVTIVGGGSLGCEIALQLKNQAPDLQITQIYAEPGVMHKSLPEYFRAYLTAMLRTRGVDQKNFSLLTSVDVDQMGRLSLAVDSWEQSYLPSDYVLFSPTKIDAAVELMEEAGLEVDVNNGGGVVNHELMAFSDIYVGGDAASYPNKYLGRRRDQNYDHAMASGAVAAKNMVGAREVYENIPSATVNLATIGIRNTLVGNCDSRLETVGFWEKTKSKKQGSKTEDQFFFTSKYNKGVTFYLDGGYIVGVLLTNMEDKEELDRAKECIKHRVDYSGLARQDLETELREQCGFELQLPMVRTTLSKGHEDKEKREMKNIYKGKRHVTEGLQSHKTDTLKDGGKMLYWGKV